MELIELPHDTFVHKEEGLPDVLLSKDVQKFALQQKVLLTREYSFKWNRTQMVPRDQRVPELLALISKITGIRFEGGDGKSIPVERTSVRLEYGLVKFLPTCGSDLRMISARCRDYLAGEYAGTRTFDIKANYLPSSKGIEQTRIKEITSHPLHVSKAFRKNLEIDKLEEGGLPSTLSSCRC